MSRAERRGLVEREAPALPVSRQCRLLAVSRASVYRRPAEITEEDCTIVALIDRQYLARPYYGSRQMAAWLATQGHVANRKRVRRLMRLAGLVAIYQRPNTSKPAVARSRPTGEHDDLTSCLKVGQAPGTRAPVQHGPSIGYAPVACPAPRGRLRTDTSVG